MADPKPAPAQSAAGPQKQVEKKIETKEFKFEKIEKNEAKEHKIEIKEHKDVKVEKVEKNEHKEHKDAKQEKLEKNEVKEHKDAKHEKQEKPEIKEHKDAKLETIEKFDQADKFSLPEKTVPKEKDGKELVEVNPGDLVGDPVLQRISALEQGMVAMQHFIASVQRPDLSQGALSGEADVKPAKPGR
jgi:hypothetical protein